MSDGWGDGPQGPQDGSPYDQGSPPGQSGYGPQQPGQYPPQYPGPYPPQYPGQFPGQFPPNIPPYGYMSPGTNGLAIASLVLGIVWIYWVTSILAVVFGHIALVQINQTGQSGRGMAIAGLVLGYVWLGLLVFALLFAAAVIDDLDGRMPASVLGGFTVRI